MTTGVRIPRDQMNDPEDRGTPFAAGAGVPALMVPAKWYDEQGRPHQEYVFVVGNVAYRDPNGEAWADSLQVFKDPVATKVVQQANAQFEAMVLAVIRKSKLQMPLPAGSDGVEVLADETDRSVVAPAS
jgi:hypothetical protein